MRILLLAASALALTIGTSSFAQGNRGGGGGKPERVQGGGGHGGGGHGGGQQARGGRDGGGPVAQRGGGRDKPGRGAGGGGRERVQQMAVQRGPDREARGGGRDRGQQMMAQRGGPDREVPPARGSGGPPEMRGNGGRGGEDRGREPRGGPPQQVQEMKRERMAAPGQGGGRGGERLTQRRAAPVTDPGSVARLSWDRSQAIGRGCPPGLAKKNNGCMPPGQARQVAQQQTWYSNWWSYPQATNYVYDNGYLLSFQGDGVDSFIPLLGGALWEGQAWPTEYQAISVPDYHVDYFGLQDGYDYRYADGAIYGVDPTSQMIQTVAALIAGDEWAVGQQMPAGYDIYNVPYEFRDDYQDTADSMYRYSDGYVYQIDPTTQLIQAAIQLIT